MMLLKPKALAALLSLALVSSTASVPTLAEETALPTKPQSQSEATESAKPEVESEVSDQTAVKREKIMADAVAAVQETKSALALLEEGKSDEALAALERATGKLELILARDPELALAPVDVVAVTYDLFADLETIEAVIEEAEDFLEDGEIQKARPLVASLASEIVIRTTSIPLATYPDAIKAITPLIDDGKIEEAKAGLQVGLNTLVVTDDAVIPLPILRAKALLGEAEKLAENEKRTKKESKKLNTWLDEARKQLKMAELLGYGTKESYKPIYAQLDQIEKKSADDKGGKGWFDKIKQQVSELL